ncbi:MAG: histidine kinase [Candidatus Aminicenantes bacterium]|nr:histidine kinase [Candidatus Aminicenantes bacterium]
MGPILGNGLLKNENTVTHFSCQPPFFSGIILINTMAAIRKIFQTLQRTIQKKPPKFYPWSFFKELEDSLNLIEDLDQIGHNFLGRIKEYIPAKKLILVIYDQDLVKFKVSNFLGIDETEVKKISFNRNDHLVRWLKVNQTYFYRKEQRGVFNYFKEKEKNILETLGIELCYPLIAMNRLIGIILIGPKDNYEKFSKQERSFISSLTPQTGIALENAVLYKEQRERFRRMSRADKLATIGELAAGAAHEIRNPLTAIKSSLQYIKTKSRVQKEIKLLDIALKETERIDKILSGLLHFSRPSEIKKEKGNVLEILEESLELISFQVKKQRITIVRDFPSSPVILNGDKAQLKQLFLNLFLNSLQSMKDGEELKIEVTSAGNQTVLISITDNGEGIPEENLDRIFDPFFTTKKGGTGLGLSICYGITQAHKGEIEVKSKLNQGTSAFVKLPSVR